MDKEIAKRMLDPEEVEIVDAALAEYRLKLMQDRVRLDRRLGKLAGMLAATDDAAKDNGTRRRQ